MKYRILKSLYARCTVNCNITTNDESLNAAFPYLGALLLVTVLVVLTNRLVDCCAFLCRLAVLDQVKVWIVKTSNLGLDENSTSLCVYYMFVMICSYPYNVSSRLQ